MSEIDNKLTLIQVLVQGQTFAKQLQILLGEPVVREDGFAASQLFVDQILTSFSESIDRINHQLPNENQTKGRGRRRRRSNSSDHHPYSCGGSTENRHDSRPSLTQDKRGCYKRRSLETRTKVSPTPEDGQAWRKYGQKIILNSKFPRSYFRCTHKFDQGCKATKQVQIMEENPQLYQITYIGFHTCGDTLKGPTLFVPSETDPNPQDVVVSRRRVDFSTISSSPQQSVAVKEEEHKEQDTKSDLTDNINSFPHPDIMDLELSNSVSQMYSCFGALEDVTSQFDHPDFQIDNFFLGVDVEGHLTPHL